MEVSAVIVAARLGLRHNVLKPQLALGGSTVLRTTVAALRAVDCRPVVVVSGRNTADLMHHLKQKNLFHVVNQRYDQTDMLHSYCLGLTAADPGELIFLLPADAPLLNSDSLRLMLDYMRSHAQCDVLQPQRDGRFGHPVLLRHRAVQQLLTYDQGGGLRAALASLPVQRHFLPLADDGLFLDVDKADDYARFCLYMQQQALRGPLRCRVDISLGREKSFFDYQLATLLEQVRLTGSLALACQQLELSYSKGWKMIKGAQFQLGFDLVESCRGGSRRGGSRLTAAGEQLLDRYLHLLEQATALCDGSLRQLLDDLG